MKLLPSRKLPTLGSGHPFIVPIHAPSFCCWISAELSRGNDWPAIANATDKDELQGMDQAWAPPTREVSCVAPDTAASAETLPFNSYSEEV